MPKFRTLLKNPNFLLYSIGQAFSQFGDRLVQIVLIGFVYKKWPGSAFHLAKLLFFTVLPSFFISPIAGVYVDRWNKRRIMVISDLLRGTAILLIPIFFLYGKTIAPLYASIFVIFAAACFFLPARLAIIPNIVSDDELLIANSASSITWVVSGIAGFGFGGILAEWIGIKNSLYVNAVIYFLSAASFILLAHKATVEALGKNEIKMSEKIKTILKKSFLYELKEGIRTVLTDKNIRFVSGIFFILFSIIGALYVVVVVFVQETLQSMTKYIGVISMCVFLGFLAGSYLYGKAGHKFQRAKTVFLSLFLCGVFVAVFAVGIKVFKSILCGSVTGVLVGFFIAPVYIAATTIIHESTGSNLRGRIFSSIGIIMNAGFLIFMFLSSVLAEYMDKVWILIGCGSVFSLVGILGMVTLAKDPKRVSLSSF